MRSLGSLACSLAIVSLAAEARAGGGPMNVVVLYNADVPAAVNVAQHYEQVRSLPKGHLCGLSGILETDTTIDVPTFKTKVQAPLDACIAALPHPELVDYLVLVRGLPYAVNLPSYGASLQAVIQVRHGKKIADGSELAGAGEPGDTDATVANPSFPPTSRGFPRTSRSTTPTRIGTRTRLSSRARRTSPPRSTRPTLRRRARRTT